jgi:hypothetical protein
MQTNIEAGVAFLESQQSVMTSVASGSIPERLTISV